MKIRISLLIVIAFNACFVSKRQECYLDNSSSGGDCQALLATAGANLQDKPVLLNGTLLICLQEYQIDQRCKKKPNYIPVPRLN